MRSAWMTSDPCVSTTFPSNVAVFLASSAIMLFDSMLSGLSRSARSASAGPAAHVHVAARARAATPPLLLRRRIERAFDLRLQGELLLVPVYDHADAAERRVSVGDRHTLVRAEDSLVGEHVEEFRADAKFRLQRRRLAQDEHVAVQIGFPAFPIYGAAARRSDEVAAVRRDLNHARIKHFPGAVVGEMSHLRRGKRVFELPRRIELLNGEVFDDRVRIVPRCPRVTAGTLEDGVVQPQRQHPEERHQGERQQRSDARFHAIWWAMARSSVS